MQLQLAGWDEFWARQFTDFARQGLRAARVIAQHRGGYVLWGESGEAEGEIAGAFLYRAAPGELPAAGDWVAIRQHSPADLAIITDVLPRRTKLSRKASGRAAEEQVIAANVDVIFIVCGLDHDYNLRRLERYLVAVRQSGATAVIVLNKADICPHATTRCTEVQGIAPEVPVLQVTGLTDASALLPFIEPGKTAALVGSSGAGKSTIVNQLLGRAAQVTQPTRTSDGRGRHTTTDRELFFLPAGGLILDNPGLRELQLWAADGSRSAAASTGGGLSAFEQSFPDIEVLAEQCAYRDCSHTAEPNCAVRVALDSGAIDGARWRSYLKLRRELHHAAVQADENLRRTEKERFKKLCKAVKRNQKRR